MTETQSGSLALVSTPIGNMADITLRAIEVLGSVDAILCEDTRVTGKLLKYHGIENNLISYHANSKLSRSDEIIQMLAEGKHLALVSDAGTPTISDPGVQLVDLAHQNDINVVSVPGPSALISALSLSGFAGNQFTFFGFIPHKKGRETLFKEMAEHTRVCVAYESPHRILKTLTSLTGYLEEGREVVVAREITKMYEQVVRGNPSEVLKYFEDNSDKVKGEFVLVINIYK